MHFYERFNKLNGIEAKADLVLFEDFVDKA